MQLSEWVARRSQIITSESSCVLDDIEVEHKKKNEKKASTSNHSTQKRRNSKPQTFENQRNNTGLARLKPY
ncbi:hypothetical protein [Nostoc commune]|uniref:hypothetical protein n=1 Tax=Nostoc commune TaxID=1178 RepID=UPI0015E803B5|nr:hypothetical protein [Nostoc commune]